MRLAANGKVIDCKPLGLENLAETKLVPARLSVTVKFTVIVAAPPVTFAGFGENESPVRFGGVVSEI